MKPKQPFNDPEIARDAQAYLLRKCAGSEEYIRRGAKTDQSFADIVGKFRFDDEVTLDIDLRHFSRLCMDNLTDDQWFKLHTEIRVKHKNSACPRP